MDGDSTKDRILEIMNDFQMSQKEFAARIKISEASLSSILNGRTNLSTKHVKALHRAFPQVSTNWVLFGEGDKMNGNGKTEKSNNQSSGKSDLFAESDELSAAAAAPIAESAAPTSAPQEVVKIVERPIVRTIREIRIFFDDGTYETYTAAPKS